MNDQIMALSAAGKSTREIAAQISVRQSKVNRTIQKGPSRSDTWGWVRRGSPPTISVETTMEPVT